MSNELIVLTDEERGRLAYYGIGMKCQLRGIGLDAWLKTQEAFADEMHLFEAVLAAYRDGVIVSPVMMDSETLDAIENEAIGQDFSERPWEY